MQFLLDSHSPKDQIWTACIACAGVVWEQCVGLPL